MNVATLQQFLRSLAPALQAAGSGPRVAQDLERACRGLEPFGTLDLDTFAGFLARCAEFQRSGSVAPSSGSDLGPVQQVLRRLDQARERLGAGDPAARTELLQAQRELGEVLTRLTDAAGLTGKLKGEKWVKQQADLARARAHARAFRELAARITDAAAYDRDDIRADMSRLEKEVTADEWKLLSTEFGLPSSTKGAKGIGEVLAKLTGHRPAKAKAPRKPAAAVDEAKVTQYADALRALLERAKTEAQLPEAEVDDQLNRLEGLGKDELIAVATRAGVERPGRSAGEVLNKIKTRLTAGRRVTEQTAH
jgi:hypothetical protein